ncbi:Thioredoxin [Botrimarina colliarenosi]|uniref:Thioredoxin n=1 Tax=Botrimarina colliarenosi TaxID=2528001 RepID=A0A5C6AII6_9BACT|nr:DUF255 domain-containing protein [Botrimarina colliarenosi]TWT99872.1 Thioredoxin [Botrimarina colliarenosi]
MSRLVLPLIVVVCVLAGAVAQAEWPFFGAKKAPAEIAWVDGTADAFVAARQTGRPILVYVTAEQCGFCRKMERETWSDPAVAELVAAGFVPLKLNADHHPDEVAALRIKAYPTTVLVSPQGKPFAGRAGFLGPEKLAELLQPAVATNEIRQPLN